MLGVETGFPWPACPSTVGRGCVGCPGQRGRSSRSVGARSPHERGRDSNESFYHHCCCKCPIASPPQIATHSLKTVVDQRYLPAVFLLEGRQHAETVATGVYENVAAA